MSKHLYTSIISSLILALTGCAYTTDISSKNQFHALISGPSQTKRQLRLYDIDDQSGAGKNRFNLTTVDQGSEELIAFIPAGHPIKIEHIYVHHDLGGAWEQAVGEIIVDGQSYPFGFYMGSSLSEGPGRLFKAFEVNP